jgi:acyl transferase domain-containing protein
MTTETCASISGHPKALATFRSSHLPSSTVSSRLSAIHALYHSPELTDVKTQIMADLASRSVKFPEYTNLRRPLRSTVTGEVISPKRRSDDSTLAEEVVDMTILHPVNFDRVVSRIKADIVSRPQETVPAVSLVNLGPGNVLWRSTARSLSGIHLSMVDWSSGSHVGLCPHPSPRVEVRRNLSVQREPVAIVGMAVKFPGAVDASHLWDVLEQGLNTVSEVCIIARVVEAYF